MTASFSQQNSRRSSMIGFVCEDCGRAYSFFRTSCDDCSGINCLKKAELTTEQIQQLSAPVLPGRSHVFSDRRSRWDNDDATEHDAEDNPSVPPWARPRNEATSTRRQRQNLREGSSHRHAYPSVERPEITVIPTAVAYCLDDINTEDPDRIDSGIKLFDETMDGGICIGQSILLSGNKGLGKTSLTLDVLAGAARTGPVLMATSEQNVKAVARIVARFGHLKKAHVRKNFILSRVEFIEDFYELVQEHQPILAVLDSVQGVASRKLAYQAGSTSLLRAIGKMTKEFMDGASWGLIFVCQSDKSGKFAGPNALAHDLDAHAEILAFDEDNPQNPKRILRTTKNREGEARASDWQMTDHGLKPLSDGTEPEIVARESGEENEDMQLACSLEADDPIERKMGLLARRRAWRKRTGM